MQDRYTIQDSCCGLVDTARNLKNAQTIAESHALKHSKEDDTTTEVTVYDRMAKRGCTREWEFPITPQPIELGHLTVDVNSPKSTHQQISEQIAPIARQAWEVHPRNPRNHSFIGAGQRCSQCNMPPVMHAEPLTWDRLPA